MGKKEIGVDNGPAFMYYINDGVYGSFNCLLYDHAEVVPSFLEDYEDEVKYTSSIWGPTCDGLDCIIQQHPMPELDVGDWMIFKDMGAYTMCAASNFNGMPKPRSYYMAKESDWCIPEIGPQYRCKAVAPRKRAISTGSVDSCKIEASQREVELPAFQRLFAKNLDHGRQEEVV